MKKETKKGLLKLDKRNNRLEQSLGRLLRICHMQGLGKFTTSIKHFCTIYALGKHDRENELYAWKKSIESQLEEITKEIKKIPPRSDVGSSTFLLLSVGGHMFIKGKIVILRSKAH